MGISRHLFACAALAPLALASAAAAQDSMGGTPSSLPAPSQPPAANTAPAPAHTATPPATSTSQLGEIIVTARKTSENVQKAPASIVAVSGAELSKEGIFSPQSLDKVLPSANLNSEGPVVQSFIRGVGSNLDVPYLQPGVSFVYNGIVVPRYGTQGLLFDIGSVQVISGPQGTLYGGSASGGAVNVNTATPRNDFSGSGLLEVGNYGTAHVNVAQDAAFGDQSLRADFDFNRHDGYETGGFDAEDKTEGRLTGLFKPVNNLTALVFFSGAHDDGQPGSALNKPLADRSNPWFTPPTGAIFGNPINTSITFQDVNTYVVGANVEWRIGGNVFTYIPGFVRVADNYRDFVGGLPLSTQDNENQHSEELRWSRNEGRLKLNGGLFYLYDRIHYNAFIGAPVLPVPPFLLTIPIYNIPKQANSSYAAYLQATYSITDQLRLTVGGRYSQDHVVSAGQGTVGEAFVPFTFSATRNHPDWKVGLDYDLAPRVLLYANAQTGYVPFGYAPFPSSEQRSNFVPEARLLAFSGGVKSRFFDNRLELNDEFYYYDYLNFQAVDFNAATGQTTTAPAERSTIYGDEITLRLLLPARFEFDTGINFMSAHYDEFTGPAFNYSGNDMIDAPFANVNAALQHDEPIGDFGQLRGRVQTHYESGHWGTFANIPGTRQGAYTKTDLTLTFTPSQGRWTAQAFVDNVENQPVYGGLSVGGQPGPAAGFLEPPRTYGVRLTTSWGG